MKFLRTFLSSLTVLLYCVSSHAASLSGQVKDPANKPLANVRVVIPALQRGAQTDASGAFKIENLPAGRYAVEFRSLDYAKVVKETDVRTADQTLDVTLSGAPAALVPITISAKPQPSSTLTTPASVSVVEGRELDRNRGQQVLQSVQDQPGVNMIGEGYTYAKPIIRGLNSENIVVVEDGVRSEALQWGNEHAPEIDTLGADRIEILRGPNSLLYGSDALGGVITVNHADLPDARLGAGAFSGKAIVDAQSNNKSVGHGVQLGGAQGDWGWRTNISQRQAGNIHTPLNGEVPNTGYNDAAGNGAVGVRKDWGSLQAELGRVTRHIELQNPGASNGTVSFPTNPLSDLEYQVLQHDKAKVRAEIITAPARIELIAGFDSANRTELNAPSVPDIQPALHWIQTNYTMDLKVHHEPIGPIQGTLGVSGLRRVEQSLGPVHLTPGYNEGKVGEFIYEELPLDKFSFSAGLRSDQEHYQVGADPLIGIGVAGAGPVPNPPPNGVVPQTLSYTAFSGALGGVYHVTEPLAFAVNFGRGYRDPVPFELFAYGVHEGSGQFLIGNPTLKPEVSFNTDASVRWASPRLKGELGVFRNYIQDYIYQQIIDRGANDPSGRGFLVTQNQQSNAVLQGVDGVVRGEALDWLTLKAGFNVVRGYNKSTDPASGNHDIPHVPADNARVGAEFHQKRLGDLYNPYCGFDVKGTEAQHRVSPGDIPSAGYVLVDLHLGTEFNVLNNRAALDVGVDNLLDKGYFDYNSILKPFNIQNPGRNVFARVSVPFGS